MAERKLFLFSCAFPVFLALFYKKLLDKRHENDDYSLKDDYSPK